MKIYWTPENPHNPYLMEVEGTPTLGSVTQDGELIAVTLNVEPAVYPLKMGTVVISAEEWPMLQARLETAFKGQDANTIVTTLEELSSGATEKL